MSSRRRPGRPRKAKGPKPHGRVESDDRRHVLADRRRHLERSCPRVLGRAVGELVALESRLELALDPACRSREVDDQAVRSDVRHGEAGRLQLRLDGRDARGCGAELRRERRRGQVLVEERRVLVRDLRDEVGQRALVTRLQHHGAGDRLRRRNRAELGRTARNQRPGRHRLRSRGAPRSARARSRDGETQHCQERRCHERSQTHNPLHVLPPIALATAAPLCAALRRTELSDK